MNSNDKDFIDSFFAYIEPYQKSGVRFLAVIICFALLFISGVLLSPFIIRDIQESLPFTVNFLQLSPFEVLFNYLRIGFFLALLLTLPLFLYQFGKLKINKDIFSERINLLYNALIILAIIVGAMFLVYKIVFPLEIMILYGLNFDVAYFSSSLTAVVATFVATLFVVIMLLLLPLLRYLIKNSQLFNYATFVKYRKPVIIYSAIFSALIVLPMELIGLGVLFLFFFFWYKILVNFSKKRD